MNAPQHQSCARIPTATYPLAETNDTRDERFIDNIFAELCVRLQRAGIPIKRASLNLLIYSPQWLGPRITWAERMREAELASVDYGVSERSEYIDSPANESMMVPPRCARTSRRDAALGRSTPSMTRCGRKA